jgi:hypothetical protein
VAPAGAPNAHVVKPAPPASLPPTYNDRARTAAVTAVPAQPSVSVPVPAPASRPDDLDRPLQRAEPCQDFRRGRCNRSDCRFEHTGGPPPQDLARAARREPCQDFRRGRCSRPDCRFEHIGEPARREVCSDFLRGRCARGRDCRFVHEEERKRPRSPERRRESSADRYYRLRDERDEQERRDRHAARDEPRRRDDSRDRHRRREDSRDHDRRRGDDHRRR